MKLKKVTPSFTLIELLIVIAIIIFLAKLIAPKYTQFYAKARQAEVFLNLSSLFAAQQAHYIQHGAFSPNLQAIGWHPKGYTNTPATTNNSYTYGATSPLSQEGVSLFTGSAQTPSSALHGSIITPTHFVIKAALQTEHGIELWSLNTTGDIKKETP